ncbi:MAG: SDR family oxidoreductase [Polaromonas sp.]|uniref:SDR family NAD(P)-dependent oxidoreductase n=1 Tax=Polaromonas sp. TaxID=1869339 RepID=UPI0027362744|nr:SDR family oxidoreductase [Polaromonas sp.]MDP3798972.1 SDR family oxidoreductase [Polaromonas sp.]
MDKGSVFITGTSRGLGKALAERFLQAGLAVYGCSRQARTIDHQDYRHFAVDVSDEPSVVSMLKQIAALKVPVNLLINNAGLTQASLGILTRVESAKDILNTNLLGNFLVSRETLKLMQRQRYGRIVNFSSINVPLGSVGSALYNASKAGVDAMAKVLTRECGNADITINTLGLSLVANSGMLDSLNPKALAAKQEALLKPKALKVEEIMHAVNFFASPLARNISCQTVYFGGV